MGEQLRKSTEGTLPVSIRATSVAREQIDDLMAHFGENQTQTLLRCVERVWMMEVGAHEGKKSRKE